MISKDYSNNMTKSQIQSSWKKVTKETHKIPNWDAYKRKSKQYQEIVILRELLLFCQLLLGKIEIGKNSVSVFIFKKTLIFYSEQMKKYA